MEESESPVTVIGRTIWTVWGFLTGAMGRYLRPEVINEGNPNAHSKEKDPAIVTINKSYRESKENEEEKERSEEKTWTQHEGKMREVAGLQHSGLRVRTATVQWEKNSRKGDAVGNGDHDEDSGTSKITCINTVMSTVDQDQSSEDVEKKAQELRCNEESLEHHLNINDDARKVLNTYLVKEDYKGSLPVFTNANMDSQELVSGREDPYEDLDAKGSENNKEQGRKSEMEQADYIMECVDGKEIMDSEDGEQGLEHEQANCSLCDNKEYIERASMEHVNSYAKSRDINKENIDKQTHQEKANDEDKSESQMEEEDLFQVIYASEGGELVKVPKNKEVKEVMYKREVSTDKARITSEGEADSNAETDQVTMENIKNGQHGKHTACAAQQLCEFTGTEKEEVNESEMHEAQTEQIEKKTEMEHAEITKKETECCKMEQMQVTFADSFWGLGTNLLTVTMEADALEQQKEDIEATTSEVTLKTEVVRLDDTDHSSGSQRSEVVIKQGIARVEAEAGHPTVDPTPKLKQDTKAEVSSEELMKLTIVKTNLHEQYTDRKQALQETVYQCSLEQQSGQEKSAKGKIDETGLLKAAFYETLRELKGTESNSAGQTNETAVESTDEMSSPSPQELVKTQCFIEFSADSTTDMMVPTKTTSTEQKLLLVKHSEVMGTSKPATTALKCQQADSETDTSKIEHESYSMEATSETCTRSTDAVAPVLDDMSKTQNLLKDQLNYSECIIQDKSVVETESYRSKHGSSESSDLPPLQTLKELRNSQKDVEEDSTVETALELSAEIKAITALGVLEEVMNGLTKGFKEGQRELSKQIESPDSMITRTKEEKIELLNNIVEHREHIQVETMDTGSEACGQIEVGKMVPYTRGKKECKVELNAEGKNNTPHKYGSVSETPTDMKKELEVDDGKTIVDSNENLQEKTRVGLKRGFEKMEREEEKVKPSPSKGWAMTYLPQVSSLDFTVQKSKIAVKNPLIRPPSDHRTLLNMTSVEPLTPPCPSGPSPLKKIPGRGVTGKRVLGFKLPGLGSGLPTLRQTEAGRKMRDDEDAQCVTSQKIGTLTDPADYVKQDQMHDKPKSTPPRQPGMGSQHMMMELKDKLKKNKNAGNCEGICPHPPDY